MSSEAVGVFAAIVGFILLAHLIASCKWADPPRTENDDEPPWDTQI